MGLAATQNVGQDVALIGALLVPLVLVAGVDGPIEQEVVKRPGQ